MAAVYDILRGPTGLRYRKNKQLIKKENVPEKVLEVLTETNVVDENGLVIVEDREPQVEEGTTTNTSDAQEGDGDDGESAEEDQPATDDSAEPETQEDPADDQPTPPETTTPPASPDVPKQRTPRQAKSVPKFVSKTPQTDPGFGFPRKNGKTVDIFDGVTPHTNIKLVGGHTVPLSKENYETKTDYEITERLRELGYQIVDFNDYDKETYENAGDDDSLSDE